MILTIDIGNTNMEFGVFRKTELIARFRLVTKLSMTSDEIGLFMTQFFSIHKIGIDDIEDIIIASVVPQVMFSIANAMRKYLKKKPVIIGENIKVNIKNNYSNPKEVGMDRLVNAYTAFKKYGGPVIIVDFGTATTFDVVNKDGEYEGGTIYPGIKISMEALTQNAAKLPKVELEDPAMVIGKDTVVSMQSGVIYGYAGAVNHMIEMIVGEMGEKAFVVATGGLSTLISRYTNCIEKIDKNLTLEGLMRIYYENKPT